MCVRVYWRVRAQEAVAADEGVDVRIVDIQLELQLTLRLR